MAKLIFKLRDVPEDEAQDIRDLLNNSNIPFYETHAGNWGIGMAGVWLKEDNQVQQATALIEDYEAERQMKMQQENALLHENGQRPSLLTNIRHSPLRFFVYVFSIVVIVYISVAPYVGL